ncbi:ribosome silencing factor [Poriferisphaera sp. WC338]|uniref:ribosome silencing factor n=1 Tax=Poriferisphaera sp. WC338 TaxID=3425129 RepID=UPI003D819CD6
MTDKEMNKTSDPSTENEAHAFVLEAARMLKDSHCEEVIAMDVRGASQICDYVLIATGTSDRQMRSVGDDLEELAENFDLSRIGHEKDPSVTWLVLDLGQVMIHLFEPTTRAHYDLEMMWGDVPRIDWRR